MTTALTFGDWLKRRRMGLGLTQKELAHRVGYAAVTLRKVEADELRPSGQMAHKLAEALELTPDERAQFVRFARDEAYWDDIALPSQRKTPVPSANLSEEPPATLRRSQAQANHAAFTPHNLSPQSTSFVGRENELNDLMRLLADPACRLLTVIGPGGMGKTRLVIELARRLHAQQQAEQAALTGSVFADGIWFVPLQGVESQERLVSAVTDALQLPPPGAIDAREHLLACLHSRRILLVLDSFEHLRQWADLLPAILAAAADARLLVTSRTALNLVQEWRYPLDGLPVGGRAAAEGSLDCAEGLFVERARHVSPAFDYAASFAAVQRICRLVEGIPLAIELAASWTRVLSCSVIASEITNNLAFLTTTARDVPERQRSMRAVFERTWQLLDDEERQVFMRLSVFRGGFGRNAAAAVAGAALPAVAALVDKTLLRWDAGDRYRMHELLRQYAAERLHELDGEAQAAQARHCSYYADFLEQRAEDVNGRRQRLALAEIAVEIENIRAAWQYALQHGRVAHIQRAAYTLYLFYDCLSRYREGADLFERAVQQFDEQDRQRPPAVVPASEPDSDAKMNAGATVAELLVCLGWLSIRLGELAKARAALQRSQTILTQLAAPPRPGPGTDPLTALGTLANVVGDYAEADRLGEAARQRSEAQYDRGNLMYAYFVLTNAAFARGRYVEASQYGARACELADQLQDRWFMAYLVVNLGDIARLAGDYSEAVRQYQIAYAIREEFGDLEGIAVALVHLGQVSLLQRDLERAQAQFRQSLGIYAEIGDRGGEATAAQGLGMTSVAQGDYRSAARHLQAALGLASAIGYTARTNSILVAAAELFACCGQPLQAAALLVHILRDPASDRATCDRARLLLSHSTEQLAPDQIADVTRGRQPIDVTAVLLALQSDHAAAERLPGAWPPTAATALTSRPDPHLAPPARPHVQVSEILVEPLTSRELGILHLLAAGRSNAEIAAEFVIAPTTAKWYVSQILGKLGVHSRTQAIARGRELGLLV